jgi:hypothetical protein
MTIISHWTERMTALLALVLVFTLKCVVTHRFGTLPLIIVYLVYLIHNLITLTLFDGHMLLTSYSNLHFYTSKFS